MDINKPIDIRFSIQLHTQEKYGSKREEVVDYSFNVNAPREVLLDPLAYANTVNRLMDFGWMRAQANLLERVKAGEEEVSTIRVHFKVYANVYVNDVSGWGSADYSIDVPIFEQHIIPDSYIPASLFYANMVKSSLGDMYDNLTKKQKEKANESTTTTV